MTTQAEKRRLITARLAACLRESTADGVLREASWAEGVAEAIMEGAEGLWQMLDPMVDTRAMVGDLDWVLAGILAEYVGTAMSREAADHVRADFSQYLVESELTRESEGGKIGVKGSAPGRARSHNSHIGEWGGRVIREREEEDI